MSDSPSETGAFEADPAEPAPSDVIADSSPAADGGDASLIDSVSEVLKSASEQETSPGSDTDSADTADPDESTEKKPAEDLLDDLTEQELSRYGPRTQKRIRHLVSQRTEARREIDTLRPKAESYEKIEQYAQENRLTNEDLSVVFELAALIRNKPDVAYDRLQALASELAKTTGHVLPPEMQERVKLGYISEEDARELAKSKARATLIEQQAREREEQQRVQNEAAERKHIEDMCRATANRWDQQHASSDPDWAAKQKRIADLVSLEVYRNGHPKTQEDVVKLLDGFLAEVNAEYARFKPKPKEVRPLVSGTASPRAKAEPQTLAEAVELALAQ